MLSKPTIIQQYPSTLPINLNCFFPFRLREIRNIFITLEITESSLFNILPVRHTMNSSDPLMQPLSFDELNILEHFLVSEQTPPDSLASLEMLDGYMTAAAAGPQVFQVDDWYASIWDQEKKLMPEFTSTEEADLIGELIVRHNNSITRILSEEPEEFLPLYERVGYESEEEEKLAVEEWAMGFIIGMELAYDAWEPFFDNEQVSLFTLPMFMLGKVSEESESLTEEEILDLTESMANSVILINSFWHSNEDKD